MLTAGGRKAGMRHCCIRQLCVRKIYAQNAMCSFAASLWGCEAATVLTSWAQ